MPGPSLRLPGGDGAGRAPYIVAVLINVALIALLVSVVSVPVIYIMRNTVGRPPVAETVTFTTPAPIAPLTQPDTAGQRRVRTVPPKPPSAAPIPPPSSAAPPITVAPPVEIPAGIIPPRRPDSAVAQGIGVGGIPGLSPRPIDPRLRGTGPVPIPDGVVRARTSSPDSAVGTWVRTYWDSVAKAQAVAATSRRPGDWTAGSGDNKWGADPQWIYFGKYRLPTMLLAFLPIYSQGNPTAGERNRQLDGMRRDIMFHAARAANEDEFQNAVKKLRERKEQEHQAELARKAAAAAKPPPP